MRILKSALAILFVSFSMFSVAKELPDPTRDILVTFDNDSAASSSASLGAPYSHRKRYTIARQVRRNAAAIAKKYSLEEIEHWPIRSLAIYCFVYRVPEGADRQFIVETLNADVRVESAQTLQSFETSMGKADGYDDTYANLQYGLDVLGIPAAHRTTRGAGIRIAIIDSDVDRSHEDLKGRIQRVRVFLSRGEPGDRNHGTAIASIIGARSNNALGIVGVAPEATLELYVSCWSGGVAKSAICDSFSLSKAIDNMLENPPHVLNLSLSGPYDPLLERLIQKAIEAGVVVIAAGPTEGAVQRDFPSNMVDVISVGTVPIAGSAVGASNATLFAPGNRILVAVPADQYDFRSGSSLAAAHVSGVVALLLSVVPDNSSETIRSILQRSQVAERGSIVSINACAALNLAGPAYQCHDEVQSSERDLYLEDQPGFGPVRRADNGNPFVGVMNPQVDVNPFE